MLQPVGGLSFERLEDRMLLAPLMGGSPADSDDAPSGGEAATVQALANITVAYNGTTGNDVLQLFLAQRTLKINTQIIRLDPAVARVVLDGLAGNDTLYLVGSAGNENVALLPMQTLLLASTSGLKGNFKSVETVQYTGNGGNDLAQLFDTTGNDALSGQVGSARMVGTGYDNRASDVDSLFGISSGTGVDTARLYDSAGNDLFVNSINQSSLNGNKLIVRRFDDVIGYAVNGGNDSAALYGTDVVDLLEAGPTLTSLVRIGGIIGRASGFENVEVNGLGERDQGQLTGSAGVDTLFAFQDRFVFSAPGFRIIGNLIDSFVATAVGAGDIAVLADSPGNDAFQGAGNRGDFDGDLADYTVIGFSQVTIQASTGFNISAINSPINYTLIEQGSWI